MKTKIVGSLLLATLILSSCNQYKKTPSGMAYKISGSSTKKLVQGNVIKFNVEYKSKINGKDSILNSTYGKMPAFLIIDTAKLPKHNFTEVILQCGVGNHLDFVLNVDSLKAMKQIPQDDKSFTKGQLINGKLDIVKLYSTQAEAEEDYKKLMAIEQQKNQQKMEKEMLANQKKNEANKAGQIAELKKYLDEKKIKATLAPAGVYVEVLNAGDAFKADTGRTAYVMYIGKLMDGKIFDANLGADAKHKEPLDVPIGRHKVIPGWEEGLKYFGKGGKGRLYVPAALAYGEQGIPGQNGEPAPIPSNANLIFDIEIADVKPTPAPQPRAARPSAPPAH